MPGGMPGGMPEGFDPSQFAGAGAGGAAPPSGGNVDDVE